MQEAHRPPCSKCSLCWSVSWQGEGGYPIQSWTGGVPYPVLDGGGTPGYPLCLDLGWGTPCQLGGLPPTWTWDGVLPYQLDGVPPCLDLGWGTPHQLDGVCPLDLGTDTFPSIKILPSLVLCTRAVMMTMQIQCILGTLENVGGVIPLCSYHSFSVVIGQSDNFFSKRKEIQVAAE